MRKISLTIFVFSCFLVSCSNFQKSKTSDTALISGKILNPTSEKLRIQDDSYFISTHTIDTIINIDSSGSFKLNFKLHEAGFYKINFENNNASFFLMPGDSIFILFNITNATKPFNVKGSNADKDEYITKYFDLCSTFDFSYEKYFTKSPEQFVKSIDSLYTIINNHLKDFQKNRNLNQQDLFLMMMKSHLSFEKSKLKAMYPIWYQSYLGKYPELDKDYINNILDKKEINDNSNLKYQQFNEFLNFLIGYSTEKELKQNKKYDTLEVPYPVARYKVINELLTNDLIKTEQMFSFLNTQIREYGVAGLSDMLNEFNRICKDTCKKNKIQQSYLKMEKIKKGEKAPIFSCLNLDRNTVSLADFKGKYVYIDIWATWCGACRKEIQILEELKVKYSKKDIVFVSISIDNDFEKWKQFVKQNHMTGIQLISDEKNPVQNTYMTNGAPYFILIDKEQKIINSRAPRPSMNIENLLNDCLKL